MSYVTTFGTYRVVNKMYVSQLGDKVVPTHVKKEYRG